MSSNGTEKMLLNVSETAKIMGVSAKIVYQMCNRPDFPAIRISPRRIGVSRAGLERWLDEQIAAKEDM